MQVRERMMSALNGVARSLAPRVPLSSPIGRVLRRLWWSLPPPSTLPPLYRIIGEFGRTNSSAFFVQIGANDGTSFDPLRNQMVRRRWRGVMVEPMPHIFERLQHAYANAPGIRLENVAISDHDGTMRLYYIPESPDDLALPSWYQGLASFNKDVILSHSSEIAALEHRIAEIDVPCVTFGSLCRKLDIDHVDLIHTDTEGYDFEILKSIDLGRFPAKLIIFEHYHMDRSIYDSCVHHLSTLGYETLAGGMDTLCLRRDALSRSDRRLTREWTRSKAQPILKFRSDVEDERRKVDPSSGAD